MSTPASTDPSGELHTAEEIAAFLKVEKLSEFPFKESYGGECPGVYWHRLLRDGWNNVRDEIGAGDDHIRVFEKVLPTSSQSSSGRAGQFRPARERSRNLQRVIFI